MKMSNKARKICIIDLIILDFFFPLNIENTKIDQIM